MPSDVFEHSLELITPTKKAHEAIAHELIDGKEFFKISDYKKPKETGTAEGDKWVWTYKDIKWKYTIALGILHLIGIPGIIHFHYSALCLRNLKLYIWTHVVGYCSAFGVTAGIHRFWTHKSYEAKTPLKIILAICFLTAGQTSIRHWVRDHRIHHKFSDTDADPHNSNRGFFFCHVGWLLVKKHPEVIKKGRQIDLSDIDNDPIASFCDRHFFLLAMLFCFVIPIVVPIYFWNEDVYLTVIYQISRYVYALNVTWCINSVAHFFGNKPYNRYIRPTENRFLSYIAFGEGWHNYHHTFPSDYRTGELGGGFFNTASSFINFFEKCGWAYNLKVPAQSIVEMTISNKGDGSHAVSQKLAKIEENNQQFSGNTRYLKVF